jgi:hypothetical protein
VTEQRLPRQPSSRIRIGFRTWRSRTVVARTRCVPIAHPQPTPTGLDTAVRAQTLGAHRPRPAATLDTSAQFCKQAFSLEPLGGISTLTLPEHRNRRCGGQGPPDLKARTL